MRRDYETNLRWLFVHYDELLSKYPEEYVAVYDQQPVAHSNDIQNLQNQLNNLYGEHKIEDLRSIAVRQVTKKTEQLIL